MKSIHFCFISLTLLCIQSLTHAEEFLPDDSPILRETAVNWIKTNFAAVDQFRDNVIRGVESEIKSGKDILLTIDGDILAKRKPMMLYTYQGELFTYQLNPGQAKSIGLYAGILNLQSFGKVSLDKGKLDKPIFKIEEMRFNTPQTVFGDKPIDLSFKVKTIGKVPGGKLILRIKWQIEDKSRIATKFYDQLPEDGVIHFTLDPVFTDNESPVFGPLMVFAHLLTTEPFPAGAVASNIEMQVVDILPNHEAYLRYTLSLTEKLVGVLDKIKDRDTAQAAIQEYTSIAVKSKSVADAMDRLGKTSPDQDRLLEEKYGPRLNQITQRMQALITRLEQADYAGNQFFDQLQKTVEKANSNQ